MSDIVELTVAGQVASTPMGATISVPYFPWSPADIREMTEDDREYALKSVRAMREAVMRSLK